MSASPAIERHFEQWHLDNDSFSVSKSTPLPYLPLRKRSALNLRHGKCSPHQVLPVSAVRNGDAKPADYWQSPTSRRSHKVPRNSYRNVQAFQEKNDTTYWHHPAYRPTTLTPRSHTTESRPSPPRILRTATSIPDYSTVNAAHPSTVPATRLSDSLLCEWSSLSTLRRGPTFWRDGGANSVRESLRSALTSGSSTANMNSTERGSIWTNGSSTSEGVNQDGEWTRIRKNVHVEEDDIAMYAGEVSDETSTDAKHAVSSKPIPSSPLAPRCDGDTLPLNERSTVFAPPEVMLKPFAPAQASISTQAHIGASILMNSSDLDTMSPLQERLKALIGPARDRYGFKKENHYIKLGQYDAWNALYTRYLERRQKKWMDLMRHHRLTTDNPVQFPPKSEKVKRYVRKGIPPKWRGAAWFFYAGGPLRLAKYPDLYSTLVSKVQDGGLGESDRENIERDLYRTFPDHVKFKPDMSPAHASSNFNVETAMISSLRLVLQTFAIHNPKIGYCQSLNFLAGHLLLFLDGDEEKAFHMLCILTSEHIPGTHSLTLEGANVDMGVLMMCLQESLPTLWTTKLDDRADTSASLAAGDLRISTGLPTVSLAATAWFMSCFTASLPVESAARVWDCLFYEGSKTLFRVALALFKLGEREIRQTGDEPMEVFQVVQALPRRMLDANLLMMTATGKGGGFGGLWGGVGFGRLSQKVVERRREERRALYREEKERGFAMSTAGLEEEEWEGGGARSMTDKERGTLGRLKSLRAR